jgi:hypothetical protein
MPSLWAVLSIIFAFLLMVKATLLHEMIDRLLEPLLSTGGFLYNA